MIPTSALSQPSEKDVDLPMSSTPDNPFRTPAVDVISIAVRRGDRTLWIEHRLREIYIGICATTLGAFVYGQLPDIGVNRPPFPGDILVVFICTTLTVAAAMFAQHIPRSQRAQNTLILGFDTEISTADADDSD